MRPTAIDLFAGAGGMSLGFEQAGFDVLVAVDNDPVHLAVHERNFPLTRALCRDISDLDIAELSDEAHGAYRDVPESSRRSFHVDCVFGGPSCQGFSTIGRRDPTDPRNLLLDQFARVVEELEPTTFVIENVPGLLAPAFAPAFERLTRRLVAAGYTITGDGCRIELDAADFGVPQRRKRVFVVGIRADMPPPSKPISACHQVSVAEALDDLPNADEFAALVGGDSVELSADEVHRMQSVEATYARLMRTSADGLARPRSWDPACMTSAAQTRHTPAVKKRFADTPPGSEETVSRSPRLKADALSATLRAGTGRDHGSFSAARPIHHRHARVITVREAARLHSFPDWFRLHTTKWHGFRQVGNAVPPLLARAVAETLIPALGFDPARPTGIVDLGSDELLSMSLQTAADYFGYDRSLLPVDSRLLGGAGVRNKKREKGRTR